MGLQPVVRSSRVYGNGECATGPLQDPRVRQIVFDGFVSTMFTTDTLVKT
jgi:hypothetical protein